MAAFRARAAGYEDGWAVRLHHGIAGRCADLALAQSPSPSPSPSRVLDVGCETGYLLRRPAARCPPAAGPAMDRCCAALHGSGALIARFTLIPAH